MLQAMPPGYRKSRYPYVHWVGETLYYRLRTHVDSAGKPKWQTVRYGKGTERDCAAAQRKAQEREDKIRAGLIDPETAELETNALAPIRDVLADYKAHLHAKNRDRRHTATTIRYIERCRDAIKAQTLRDFRQPAVERWLSATFKGNTRPAVVALKGMMAWAKKQRLIGWNPLEALEGRTGDPTRQSRAMTRQQFDAILAGVKPSRKAFYLLAAHTGLRWREIARLTWNMLDLVNGTMILPGRVTKNGKPAILPIPPDAVAALSAIRKPKAGLTAPVFRTEPRLRTWKTDLERAGIEYRDEEGRQFDRKCLRLSYGTWLYQSKVDLRLAQRLMRHSDPKLTAKIYTEIGLDEMRSAQAAAAGQSTTTIQRRGQIQPDSSGHVRTEAV